MKEQFVERSYTKNGETISIGWLRLAEDEQRLCLYLEDEDKGVLPLAYFEICEQAQIVIDWLDYLTSR